MSDQPAPSDKVFYVTVRKVEELTYRVTRTAHGVGDEDAASAFVESADIETLDEMETHSETVSTEITAAEEVHEGRVEA